ncbi:MAG: hypothetical protein PHV68_04215, partial [Candidatus Gastranaerophilales bacterium]|nr:hypothetical protein [Candidatus Gastranaerophilales bacterium]
MNKLKKTSFILILSVTVLACGHLIKTFASDLLIQANKQSHDGQTNITTFEGAVKVNLDDITVKSPKAAVRIGKDNKPEEAIFIDGAYAIKDNGISQNEIKANIIRLSLLENKLQAEGNAFTSIKEKKKLVVTIKADYQEFDKTSSIMTAKGNVIINYKEVETLSDKAKIFVKENGDLKEV